MDQNFSNTNTPRKLLPTYGHCDCPSDVAVYIAGTINQCTLLCPPPGFSDKFQLSGDRFPYVNLLLGVPERNITNLAVQACQALLLHSPRAATLFPVPHNPFMEGQRDKPVQRQHNPRLCCQSGQKSHGRIYGARCSIFLVFRCTFRQNRPLLADREGVAVHCFLDVVIIPGHLPNPVTPRSVLHIDRFIETSNETSIETSR